MINEELMHIDENAFHEVEGNSYEDKNYERKRELALTFSIFRKLKQ